MQASYNTLLLLCYYIGESLSAAPIGSDTCTQELILSIAGAISKVDIDTSHLATCLKVSQENTSMKKDQILSLLLSWQSQQGPSCTKTNLFQCLRQLNNPPIDEILKKYG